jgi:methylenetetrahydrofolate reductase (NADPH)
MISERLVLSNYSIFSNFNRNFPWRGSRSNLNGMTEEVRPINWANRPKSYIKRTVNWDEFPNGRWGDNRSPAYGELSDSHFFRPVEGKKEDLRALWGEAPLMAQEVYDVFALYIEGKIPIIPWCESSLQAETIPLSNHLARINRSGFLTINSQPAVNGERSDHPVYGWGGPGGRVYQKAYVEFFCSPRHLEAAVAVLRRHPSLAFHAIDANAGNNNGNKDGSSNGVGSIISSHNYQTTAGGKGVTALTWGCFPNKEILQPTVFDPESFVVWSKEVFELWTQCWASLYDDDSESCELLYQVQSLT